MTVSSITSILLILALAACAPAGEQVDVDAERSALLAADKAWSQTPPDVDGFVSFFTQDGINLAGGAPPEQGHEAIRPGIAELFGGPGFALSWSASAADVSASGDLGYTIGSYEITSNDAAGNPQTLPGKYLTVWKKQLDGQWKVAVDAPSENQPRPIPTTSFELSQDSVEVDPDHYQVVLENERVRVLRISYGPNEKSAMHEHPEAVAVFLTDDQEWRMTAPDGSIREESNEIGEATWTEAGTHLPENGTDEDQELILVELK